MLKRRKYERFQGKSGAFAALFRTGNLPVAGKIVDISIGGIKFNYLSLAGLGEGQFNLHVFGSKERFFHLDRIKCKVIYSSKVPEKSWGDLISWHSGVKFERLSETTLAELREFLSDFGVAYPQPP
ncbi:MAG: PilZ domain-containing protein [Syntrophobacteraceae bacterium]